MNDLRRIYIVCTLLGSLLARFPTLAADRLRVGEVAIPTDTVGLFVDGVDVPVLLENDVDASSFSISLGFDTAVATLEAINLEGTDVEPLEPDPAAVIIEIDSSGESGWAVLAVAFDLFPPFEDEVLPAGGEKTVALLRFRPVEDLYSGATAITLGDSPRDPPIVNDYFDIDGQPRQPALEDGILDFVAPGPDFLRGDADSDRNIALEDAQLILSAVFLSGIRPCEDAMDVDDDGNIELEDALGVLTFVFVSDLFPIRPPFPVPGPDPTRDNLDCFQPGAPPG